MNKKILFASALVLLAAAGSLLGMNKLRVMAGNQLPVTGWAWGGTLTGSQVGGIGWIDFGNDGGSYGVNVDQDTGTMSGYAWSSNYGWISFNQADINNCPDNNCIAKLNGNQFSGSLSGWARICSGTTWGTCGGPDRSDGETGWIKLSGGNYGITVSNGVMSGYVWAGGAAADEGPGWINFVNVSVGVPAGGFDFSVQAFPGTLNAQPGQAPVLNVSTRIVLGVGQPVTFSISGLPAGATYSFDTPSCTPDCTSNATIDLPSSTVTGTYSLLVTGTAAGVTRSSPVTMYVNSSAFDYNLTNTGDITMAPGQTGTTQINLGYVSGTAQPVSLSVNSNSMNNANPSFTTQRCAPDCSSTITIHSSPSDLSDIYLITVFGGGPGVPAKQTTFRVLLSSNPQSLYCSTPDTPPQKVLPSNTNYTYYNSSFVKAGQTCVSEVRQCALSGPDSNGNKTAYWRTPASNAAAPFDAGYTFKRCSVTPNSGEF